MAFVFNPLTGQLDEVSVPLKSGTTQPGFGGPNGDLEVDLVSSNGILYFRTGGNLYSLTGTLISPPIAPVSILRGQPIPIGMGLTMTYANNIN